MHSIHRSLQGDSRAIRVGQKRVYQRPFKNRRIIQLCFGIIGIVRCSGLQPLRVNTARSRRVSVQPTTSPRGS